jgi:crotonobetainyl-CoA:carnitine CoA-transferase CaiB-like acyl-CoA transferase
MRPVELFGPRFATARARAENDEALASILESTFQTRSATEWAERLDSAGVPCEICDPNFGLSLHEDPEMIRRRLVTSYHDHYVGKLDQVGLLFDLSATPATIQGPPLIVGQHTTEILAELGYSEEEVSELLNDRAVMAWSPDAQPANA